MRRSAPSRSPASLLLTACGDQTDSSSQEGGSGKETKSGAPLFSKLPEKYQKSGVIKVGTNAEYAPMESVENGKIVGVDPDLAEALGKQLGVRFEFTSGSFDGLITALNSGRHDIAMSSITDNKQRQEGLDESGKKLGEGVDFVDYFLAGTAVYTKKGNPQNIKSIEDLCGKAAAVQRGTTYEKALKTQSKACTDGGEKAVKIESFENDTEAQTRVKSGGAVAGVNDYPVAVDLARKADGGKAFEVVGEQIDSRPVRHRRQEGQHGAARRPEGGCRRDHRRRFVPEGARQVGRRYGSDRQGRRQRRQVTGRSTEGQSP